MDGVQSMSTRLGACRSKLLYGELRRLTMRGLRLSIVCVACMQAAGASSSVNHRRRSRGRFAGKGPGEGLRSARQVQVLGERLLGVR